MAPEELPTHFGTLSESAPFHEYVQRRFFALQFEGSKWAALHRVLYTQQGKINKESFETEQAAASPPHAELCL